MSSIMEFINTGKLDFLILGISKGYIEGVLGKPDDISISKKPVIIKYGALQLSFYWDKVKNDTVLNSIHLYFDDSKNVLPQKLDLKGWMPNNRTCQKELLEQALQNRATLEIDKKLSIDNMQIGYKSSAGVTIIFEIENKKDNLVSMHITKR